MKRRKAREYTVQLLYMLDTAGPDSLAGADAGQLIKLYNRFYRGDQNSEGPDEEFWPRLLTECLRRIPEVDRLIESHSDHWKVQRMTRVDRSILRVATTEFIAFPDIDASVSIDEAVELAKRFGSEDSPPFINGILDGLWKKLAPQTPKSL